MMPRGDTRLETDLELVRRVLDGESSAATAIVERLGCVPRFVGARNRRQGKPFDVEDLQDLVQDVMLSIWRKLPQFDGRSTLETWAYGFCLREFAHRWRKRARRSALAPTSTLPSDDIGQPAEDRSAEEFEQVRIALDRLDPLTASIVERRHFEEESFEELGQHFAMAPKTARNRYYAGLRQLRATLAPKTLSAAPR